jgi:hypothetical protein
MHRRVIAAFFLVVCLTTAAPAISAPSRGSEPTVVDRIVRTLKKIFTPTILDLNDPIPPKP